MKWFLSQDIGFPCETYALRRSEVADARWHSTCKAETLTRPIGQDTYQ